MARPPDSPALKALKVARKTLARIRLLDRSISPKWVDGMVRHWSAEVERLEAVVRAQRSAH